LVSRKGGKGGVSFLKKIAKKGGQKGEPLWHRFVMFAEAKEENPLFQLLERGKPFGEDRTNTRLHNVETTGQDREWKDGLYEDLPLGGGEKETGSFSNM